MLPGPNIRTFFDGKIARLTVVHASYEVAGLIKCYADSEYGDAQSSARIDVKPKRLFLSQFVSTCSLPAAPEAKKTESPKPKPPPPKAEESKPEPEKPKLKPTPAKVEAKATEDSLAEAKAKLKATPQVFSARLYSKNVYLQKEGEEDQKVPVCQFWVYFFEGVFFVHKVAMQWFKCMR